MFWIQNCQRHFILVSHQICLISPHKTVLPTFGLDFFVGDVAVGIFFSLGTGGRSGFLDRLVGSGVGSEECDADDDNGRSSNNFFLFLLTLGFGDGECSGLLLVDILVVDTVVVLVMLLLLVLLWGVELPLVVDEGECSDNVGLVGGGAWNEGNMAGGTPNGGTPNGEGNGNENIGGAANRDAAAAAEDTPAMGYGNIADANPRGS